jgi:hypothetical protein
VRPDDNLPDEDADLIAGAQAAASWARARRSTWTSTPLDAVAPAVRVQPAELRKQSKAAHQPSASAPPTPRTLPTPSTQPSFTTRTAATLRSVAAPAGKWLPRAAAAALLVAGAVAGGRYLLDAISTTRTQDAVVARPPVSAAPAVRRKPAGQLRVNSTPAGAQVIVDGKARGVTPFAIAELSPGRHEVTLVSPAGTVRREVRIAAGETAVVEEAIFSGWVTVYSPFEVAISENGGVLRLDARNQVMLPAGVHELRMTNRALGYETVARVEVKPGEAAPVRLTPEPSRLIVSATEAAEVWVDGVRVGETPLSGAVVTLGTHEVVVRRAAGGERRFTVTVGVAPFTLNVDF